MTIIYVIAFALILFFVYRLTRPRVPEIIFSRWAHYFPDTQYSAQEYYASIEKVLKDLQAPDVSFSRVEFKERTYFSNSREYMRVRFEGYTFDICAAPYGKGFFVSWWFGEEFSLGMRILFMLPILGYFVKKWATIKTYHVRDTEEMFSRAVHLAVITTIDQLVATKGLRALTELERKPISLRK